MSKILVPGAVLPDFELSDDTGTKHRLSQLQGDNTLILLLGRGEHCPRERQHQREMLKFYEWSAVAFTELVTVLPNDLHRHVQVADLDRCPVAVPGRRRPRGAAHPGDR
jgi:peroxiredoxin